jgi:hypothetical protein
MNFSKLAHQNFRSKVIINKSMSTRRTLAELISQDDDAKPIIESAVSTGNTNIVKFVASEPAADDYDDEYESDEDDDQQPKTKKQQPLTAGEARLFEHMTHRLLPLIRDGKNEDGGDSTKPASAAATAADAGEAQLLALQVTTRSLLGAMAYHFTALFAYNGLVVVLGCGRDSSGIPSVSSLTSALRPQLPGAAGCLAIAFDVYGGLFLLNSGSIAAAAPGHVCYLPPDSPTTTEVESLGIGYQAWLVDWLLTNPSRVYLFYCQFLFPGVGRAVLNELTPGREVFSFYPPLFTKEAKTADVSALSRRAVPVSEILALKSQPLLQQRREEGSEERGDGGENDAKQ